VDGRTILAVLFLLALPVACGTGGEGTGSSPGASDPPPPILNHDACNNGIGNGAQIIQGPSGPSGQGNDQPFHSLAIDPTDPNTLFVGTEMSGLCKSTDGGQTWQRLRYGLWHSNDWYSEAWDVAIHPQGTAFGVFLAMAGGPLPITSPWAIAGVYKSFDEGSTWARSNCGILNHNAGCILYDPNDPSVLILGIGGGYPSGSEAAGQFQPGGLYRSLNGGAQWNPISSLPAGADNQAYVHLRARGSGPTTFVTFGFRMADLNENVGFLRSLDGGLTWSPFAPTMRTKHVMAFDLSTDGSTIYACVQNVFKVFKSTDNGATWSEDWAPMNGPVRVSPVDPQLVLCGDGYSLNRSTNGMSSTSTVLVVPDSVMDIEFAPSNPNIVYASTRGYYLYRSTDGGATWSLMKNLWTQVINP